MSDYNQLVAINDNTSSLASGGALSNIETNTADTVTACNTINATVASQSVAIASTAADQGITSNNTANTVIELQTANVTLNTIAANTASGSGYGMAGALEMTKDSNLVLSDWTPVNYGGFGECVNAEVPLIPGLTVVGHGIQDLATASATFSVRSSSASDGVGYTVDIAGRNAAGAVVSETVALNGTSTVSTVQSYTNVYSAVMNQLIGTSVNNGDIDVSVDAGFSQIQVRIPAGANQGISPAGYIPANTLFYPKELSVSAGDIGSSVAVQIDLWQWIPSSGNDLFRKKLRSFVIGQAGADKYDLQGLAPLPADSSFQITANRVNGTGTIFVSWNLSGFLEDTTP